MYCYFSIKLFKNKGASLKISGHKCIYFMLLKRCFYVKKCFSKKSESESY